MVKIALQFLPSSAFCEAQSAAQKALIPILAKAFGWYNLIKIIITM